MRQKKTLKLDSVFALCFGQQGSFGSEIDSVFAQSREVQVGRWALSAERAARARAVKENGYGSSHS